MKNNDLKGVYVHIPFCLRKCNYCDFLSFSSSEEQRKNYVDALCREIRRFCRGKSFRADSVFIGGGTPSVLEPKLIEQVMNTLRESIGGITDDAEISIEVNPGTMTREKAEVYRGLGINRISMGVQSLDDGVLERLGRIHRREQFLETYSILREAGFDNLNTDLMFALPGQTRDTWKKTLGEILELRPEHISFYSLIIEEGTPFYEDYKSGRLSEMDDEEDRWLYHHAVEKLEGAGYHHYEISNAAIPGRESRHNLKYWSMDEYVGFGLGAHSFMDGKRFCNVEGFDDYVDIQKRLADSDDIHGGYEMSEPNSLKDNMEEFIFTGLRKTDGVTADDFARCTGADLHKEYSVEIEKMKSEGMLEDSGKGIKLTSKGLDFANYVMREFVR